MTFKLLNLKVLPKGRTPPSERLKYQSEDKQSVKPHQTDAWEQGVAKGMGRNDSGVILSMAQGRGALGQSPGAPTCDFRAALMTPTGTSSKIPEFLITAF